MTIGLVAVPECQLSPCCRLGNNGSCDMHISDFAIHQHQHSVMCVRKAARLCVIPDLQRFAGMGRDPETLGPILKDRGGPRLIIGYGSVYLDPTRLISHVIVRKDLIHWRDRKRPEPG